jgi:hypothetical protein
MENSMSMSQEAKYIRDELLARGVTCAPDLQSVLVGVILYFKDQKQIEATKRVDRTAPPQMVSEADAPALFSGDTPEGLYVTAQFDEPEMPIDAHSSGPQFDMPAKPKAKTKKKAAK